MNNNDNTDQQKVIIGRNYDMKALVAQHSSPPPWYYSTIIALLAPLYRFKVWQRSRKNDNYQQEVADRFGERYRQEMAPKGQQNNSEQSKSETQNNEVQSDNKSMIWCHAVSLGETNTIAPLLKRLMAEGYRIWLTNTTQTGFARGERLFADEIEQGQLQHSYMPIDSNEVIGQFLAHVRPSLALFVETELWANTLYQLSHNNIPAILVNARLSEKSFINYQKITKVSQSMMDNLALIIAQDADSAKRFRMLGAESSKISVAGSLKWTVDVGAISKETKEKADIKQTIATRPVWVASSTHKGEEAIVLAVQQKLIEASNLLKPLLILVPRHPERFDEVAEEINQTGLNCARRSLSEIVNSDTQVYLADTMGELSLWYEMANVAFVGGSMVNVGGHNPIEALSMGTPVIMGRFTQSLNTLIDELKEQGVLQQLSLEYTHNKGQKIEDSLQAELSEQLYQQLLPWLAHPETTEQLGNSAKVLVNDNQEVMERQLQMIKQFMLE